MLAMTLSLKFCVPAHDPQVSLAVVVTVSPRTEDDWRILQLNRRSLESQVLQQVTVLYCTVLYCTVLQQCTMTLLSR